ncbi:lytic transglycosylase domain-containing protein [Lysobacter sp. FW306-1B-D06B]|uniref:lytic transglycosylase domain-containing protein n=1 Tax=unclassified Lysobacter TaxID=2635362 RepID=UPI00314086F6
MNSLRVGFASLGLAGLLLAVVPVVSAQSSSAGLAQPSRPAAPGRALGFSAGGPGDASPGPVVQDSEAAGITAPMRVAQGQVYRFEEDGVVHYASQRPTPRAGLGAVARLTYTYMETCYACALQPDVDFATIRLNTESYRKEIAAASRDFGVDEAVVRAIIHAESAYNPNAISRVGAQGLMQLMPATARRFGVANVFDIGQNIRGGVQYLAWLLRRFDGNLTLAAAGYNAGEGAVDRYRGVPPYDETQRYVQRVAVLAERYRSATAMGR